MLAASKKGKKGSAEDVVKRDSKKQKKGSAEDTGERASKKSKKQDSPKDTAEDTDKPHRSTSKKQGGGTADEAIPQLAVESSTALTLSHGQRSRLPTRPTAVTGARPVLGDDFGIDSDDEHALTEEELLALVGIMIVMSNSQSLFRLSYGSMSPY